MKISVCWIVKNEASSIAQSINSVKDAADELIVTDTGSTDDTVAIAVALGAKVENFAWIDDFSAARNAAISKASGDLILFLDADERLEPSLTRAIRSSLEKLFSLNKELEALRFQSFNINEQSGASTNTVSAAVLFRNKKQNRYRGRIHEFLVTPHGYQGILRSSDLRIYHTGYNETVVLHKLQRNIAIMENCLEEAADEEEFTRFAAYLAREYYIGGESEKAAAFARKTFRHPGALARVCALHDGNFLSVMYAIILTASQKNSGFSKQEVYDNFILPIREHFAKDPVSSVIPLVYDALFNMQEDRFMENLEPALQEAAKKGASPLTVYQDMVGLVLSCAAQITHRRGDPINAMEYAVRAITAGARTRLMLSILLNAVKEQPPEDIVLLLNRIFDLSDIRNLQLLADLTRRDELLPVYAYYQKRLAEAQKRHP